MGSRCRSDCHGVVGSPGGLPLSKNKKLSRAVSLASARQDTPANQTPGEIGLPLPLIHTPSNTRTELHPARLPWRRVVLSRLLQPGSPAKRVEQQL